MKDLEAQWNKHLKSLHDFYGATYDIRQVRSAFRAGYTAGINRVETEGDSVADRRLNMIFRETARHFNMPSSMIRTHRTDEVQDIKSIYCHLARKYTDITHRQIGEVVGLTTGSVYYHIVRCGNRYSVNDDFKEAYKAIKTQVINKLKIKEK